MLLHVTIGEASSQSCQVQKQKYSYHSHLQSHIFTSSHLPSLTRLTTERARTVRPDPPHPPIPHEAPRPPPPGGGGHPAFRQGGHHPGGPSRHVLGRLQRPPGPRLVPGLRRRRRGVVPVVHVRRGAQRLLLQRAGRQPARGGVLLPGPVRLRLRLRLGCRRRRRRDDRAHLRIRSRPHPHPGGRPRRPGVLRSRIPPLPLGIHERGGVRLRR